MECECCGEIIIVGSEFAQMPHGTYCKECVYKFKPIDFIEMYDVKFETVEEGE